LEHVLQHTRSCWEELRGKRIFLTGGTGFFGCWLMETFVHANEALQLNARMVVLTRGPEAFALKAPHLAGHPAVTLWKGDVRDFAFPEGEFSHVIHAGTTSSHPVPPLEMLDTIIGGTRRTLDFAVACGAKKFLLTSSGAVYGKQPPQVSHVAEEYGGAPDTQNPDSAYGEGKRVAELLCSIYAKEHGIETKIARCFAFVGPLLPLDAHFAIGNFIRDALKSTRIGVNGDGSPVRSYLYAADLAAWLWTLLFKGGGGRAYNVGSDREVTLSRLASTVADVLKPEAEVVYGVSPGARQPAAASNRYVPNTDCAKALLELEAWISLEEALTRTRRWMSDASSV
jgi:dTDP-glucose 4,6-dehydratase